MKIKLEKVEEVLKMLPTTFLYAFEFRDESWFHEETYELLKKYGAAVGKYMWPYHDIETADFAYIRFHGSPKLYYSSYTDEELQNYASIIKAKVAKELDVYCYFNNDAAGAAIENAKRLQGFLV